MARSAHEALEAISAVSALDKIKKAEEEMIEVIPLPVTLKPFSADVLTTSTPTSSIDSIGCDFKRPKLTSPQEPPRSLAELRYLEAAAAIKAQNNKMAETLATKRLAVHNSEIERLAQEHIENLKTRAQKIEDGQWWATLKKIGTAILSALLLGLGFSLIGSGNAAAGVPLLISCGLNLGNFIADQTHTWDEVAKYLAGEDEERRKKIGLLLPLAVGIIAAGCGIFGGMQSATFTASSLATKVFAILQASTSSLEGVTTIAQGIARSQLIHTEAEILDKRTALNEQRCLQENLSQLMETILVQFKEIQSGINQSIHRVIKSNQEIVIQA